MVEVFLAIKHMEKGKCSKKNFMKRVVIAQRVISKAFFINTYIIDTVNEKCKIFKEYCAKGNG